LMEHKHKIEKTRLAKLKKQRKLSELIKTTLGTLLIISAVLVVYLYAI
jgi:hypothetical protein